MNLIPAGGFTSVSGQLSRKTGDMEGSVLLVCGDLGGTGVARNTISNAIALQKAGLAVEVISLSGGVLAEQLGDIPLTLLKPARSKSRWLSFVEVARRLRAEISRRPSPIVTVSMGNHAHLGLWLSLVGDRSTRRIYRLSNDLDHRGRRRLSSLVRRAKAWLVARDADLVLCVSVALALHPSLARARRRRRCVVLLNGVDVARVQARADEPSLLRLPPGPPVIVAIGRLHGQKNYEALVQAIAHCRNRGTLLRLVIIGRDSGGVQTALQTLATELGVEGLLVFAGELENPFPILRQASAYACLSHWEGCPNSLLEAMACGTPVVVSRTAGAGPELVGEGKYGRLVDPTDIEAIADALIAQASRSEACVRPGERAWDFDLSGSTGQFSKYVAGFLQPAQSVASTKLTDLWPAPGG